MLNKFGEFEAWLEGFEYSFKDGVPNQHQWEMIKSKLNKLKDNQPTYRSLSDIAQVKFPYNNCG